MEERLVKLPDTGPAEETKAPGQLDPPSADGSRPATGAAEQGAPASEEVPPEGGRGAASGDLLSWVGVCDGPHEDTW